MGCNPLFVTQFQDSRRLETTEDGGFQVGGEGWLTPDDCGQHWTELDWLLQKKSGFCGFSLFFVPLL